VRSGENYAKVVLMTERRKLRVKGSCWAQNKPPNETPQSSFQIVVAALTVF